MCFTLLEAGSELLDAEVAWASVVSFCEVWLIACCMMPVVFLLEMGGWCEAFSFGVDVGVRNVGGWW